MSFDPGQLIVQLEGSTFDVVTLQAGGLTIGRAPDNGLALPHPLVSARHAELRLEGAGLVLTDLDSASGTLIDGARIPAHQPQLLADGAIFQIGPFVLIYRATPGSAASKGLANQPTSTADSIPIVPPTPIAAVAPAPPAPPRPAYPMPLPSRSVSRYLYDLPVVFHTNEFLGRYLQIFEAIWEPLEQREDQIAMYFDPRTCPASFLPWLAQWLDLPLDTRWPEARQRRLVASAVEIYRWRGTRFGLERMIEVCTGLAVEILEEPSQPFVFRIRLVIPDQEPIDRQLLEELIQAHKPAHVGYVLELRQAGAG